MMSQKIKEDIFNYFNNVEEALLPRKYKESSSVILSGSAGWGIKEGEDSRADWDIHVILSDEVYGQFMTEKGENYVIDDQQHAPVVFVDLYQLSDCQ